MYDPVVGRWPEEDPDGFDAGDDNLYRYVENSPTNGTDPSGEEPVATNQDFDTRWKSLLVKAKPINKKALQVTLQFAQDTANAPRWQATEVKSKLPETAWEVMELWFLPGGLAENVLIGMSGLAAPPGAASTGLGEGMIYDPKSATYQWGAPTRPNSRGVPEREEPAKTIDQLLDEQSRINPKDPIAAARIAKVRARLMALQLRGPAGLAAYELGRPLTKGEANDLQARLDDIPGYKELGKEFLDILHSIANAPTNLEVKLGAIGLGLDENLSSLRRLGATTYEKWFEKGLTRVDPMEANLSSYKFQKAFTDAANKAPQIVFDLSELDVAKALENGPRGFVSKNYTNAELHTVINNTELLGKTTFIKNGRVVKPVIDGRKVIGFVS